MILAIALLAAAPFISAEERIGPLHNPLDVAIIRSVDTTLLAWNEDSRVRARANNQTVDFGSGNDVRVATNGKDIQIAWVDQNRIAGALWSKPSDVKTLANLLVSDPWFGGWPYGTTSSTYRRAPALVWSGTMFQVFAGWDQADAAAALKGVMLTVAGYSAANTRVCWPPGLSLISIQCWDTGPQFKAEWKVRPDNAQVSTFSNTQSGYMSTHLPSVAAGKDEFLVVWKSSTAIEGARVRRDGSTAGFINVPIANSLTGKRGPQVAFDGTRYLIVFDVNSDVYGAFIESGRYLGEPFAIASSAATEAAPAVTALGDGRFAVAYTIDSSAIATRTVSLEAPPAKNRVVR